MSGYPGGMGGGRGLENDTRSPRVLVIDDEPSVAELCQEFLAGEGYDMFVAASGEEAVRRIPEIRPDCILTDINLPGMSGLEVMRFAMSVDPDVCVIVVTGYASVASAIDALRQGAYDFVRKPFDLEFVQRIVKSGISNRRLAQVNRGLIDELTRKNEILHHHEQELRDRVRIATLQMTNLYDAGKDVGADLELGPRLQVVAAKAAEMTGAAGALVYLRRETTEQFRAAGVWGRELALSAKEHTHFTSGEGPLGYTAAEQSPVRLPLRDESLNGLVPGLREPAVESLLAVPLASENQVIGVLAVLDKAGGFTPDDEGFLMLFASQAAIAVRNSQLFEHTKSLDRLKSEFVAVVSHEIRTPLTSVKGAIELLSDERFFQNTEQQAKLLSIAHANAERLLVLISDILDFSKLESSSLPMNFERQRLEPIVMQATQNLRTLMEEREIQLEVKMAPDLPDLMIDPHRIAQVLTNLLSNAIKFSVVGGRIEVLAEHWNGCVRVSVRDHGEGIAPDNLPKLFQKFTQIDSASTRTRGGAGLGLVISKGIVEQHGGVISVDSVYGEGSTFHFTLAPAPQVAAA